MSKNKRFRFFFRREYYDVIKGLPYESLGKLFCAIAEFMLDGIEPNFDGPEKAYWDRLYPMLVHDVKAMGWSNITN